MNYLFLLETAENLCSKLIPVWTIFGYIIWAIKIVVPLILIVYGMIELTKAVMEKDEATIKKAQQLLIKKLITAVLVYLVITIVGVVVSLVSNEDYKECANCAFRPFDNTCWIISE